MKACALKPYEGLLTALAAIITFSATRSVFREGVLPQFVPQDRQGVLELDESLDRPSHHMVRY